MKSVVQVWNLNISIFIFYLLYPFPFLTLTYTLTPFTFVPLVTITKKDCINIHHWRCCYLRFLKALSFKIQILQRQNTKVGGHQNEHKKHWFLCRVNKRWRRDKAYLTHTKEGHLFNHRPTGPLAGPVRVPSERTHSCIQIGDGDMGWLIYIFNAIYPACLHYHQLNLKLHPITLRQRSNHAHRCSFHQVIILKGV